MRDILCISLFCFLHVVEFFTFIPQIYKLIKTKSSKDFSLTSQILVLFMNSCWMVYWVMTELKPIELIISGIVMTEVIIQFILVVKYHNKKEE